MAHYHIYCRTVLIDPRYTSDVGSVLNKCLGRLPSIDPASDTYLILAKRAVCCMLPDNREKSQNHQSHDNDTADDQCHKSTRLQS